MKPRYSFAEYFAGIGLVGLGLGPQWELLFANDIDPRKREMFSAAFGSSDKYWLGDIFDLAAQVDKIPTTTLATASFPCIDLSLAGNRNGLNGRHSGAFWGFVSVLDAMKKRRPPLIMLENVLGWLTANNGRDFRDSIQALNQLGYTIDAFVLNAHHFTPQSRPRMFLVGAQDRKPLDEVELIARFESRPPELWTKRLVDMIFENGDLKWMALELPTPPPIRRDVESVLEKLPDDDSRWWSDAQVTRIYDQLSDSHRERVDRLRNEQNIRYALVYKRVRNKQTRAEIRTDGLAGCLRTPSGGSSKQIVFQLGRGEFKVRWMTAREYARLQGVPDEFPITVPYIRALWGFGDAVCVPAINWIAKHALEPLAEQIQVLEQPEKIHGR